jgi:Cu+-exporting ATPase
MADVVDLPVLGMTCAACVRRVEKAALAVDGVTRAEVNLPLSRARLELDPLRATAVGVAAAIRKAGYDVPADALDPRATGRDKLAAIERAHADEAAGLRRDATIAIAATVPLLVIAMAHGVLEGTASVIAQLALGTLVVAGPGMRYLRAGVRAVRHRSPDMNTLIALGAGAAWLSSTVVATRWLAALPASSHQMPALYFEAGAAIVAFVMIGKLLEARARGKLVDAVRGVLSLAPARAHRIVAPVAPALGEPVVVASGQQHTAAGLEEEVDAGLLAAGDAIVVRPGERIAADGTVTEGRSAVDESLLTGESLPVDKTEGAPVYAGTLNHQGALVVRVARAGAETALARIARAVEDAQGDKPPIARLADRVSAVFVPIVLAIAAGTFVVWFALGAGTPTAIEHMVAVLVIACPCALGLATPAAVAVGTARAAELGILFRGGPAVELASTIDVAYLDKTGTLTANTPTLVAAPDDATLRLAASAELASEHPIAKTIVAGARARGLSVERPSEARVEPGAGIEATVGGQRVLVGTREFLVLAGIEVAADEVVGDGATRSFVAIDGQFSGTIAVADPPAPAAREVVEKLRAQAIDPVMVSGDREEAARWIADQVGITRVHAGVRPTEKATLVAEERARGKRVAMVGDGINDAPALATADLGIAMGSGTDVAAATADVTLLRGIASLPAVFGLGRATMRTIRRNLLAASIYNAVCIPVAAVGLLSPVIASVVMSLSSVSVLLSSLALRRW